MKRIIHISLVTAVSFFLISCSGHQSDDFVSSCSYARYFDILDEDGSISVVVCSPYGQECDTMHVSSPMKKIVCMSTSHVAYLSAIGADSLICAVSGLDYISNHDVQVRAQKGMVSDIGYEAFLDYEKLIELKPDILVAYVVSPVEPQYLSKLRTLGVRVLVIHDHLEHHPLARVEYVRLFGALTGRQKEADAYFDDVCTNYNKLAVKNEKGKVKVLLNAPYGDAWYIPGSENYISRLINDAGGEVLGAEKGTSSSSVISLERAYRMSLQADIWLHPGTFTDKKYLHECHPLFEGFNAPVYNNTLRMTPKGGNDYWESGSVRPDLILSDLRSIFSGEDSVSGLEYYLKVE